MKTERRIFYVMTCDVDCEDDEIADDWATSKEKTFAYSENMAIREAAQEALHGHDDGDEILVVIATQEDGSDAKRCTVGLSIDISYELGDLEPVDMSEPPVDEDTGEPIKGLQDDATLSLFG